MQGYEHNAIQHATAQWEMLRQQHAHQRVLEWSSELTTILRQFGPVFCTLDEQVVCQPELEEKLVGKIE